jgi:hypothetical protein
VKDEGVDGEEEIPGTSNGSLKTLMSRPILLICMIFSLRVLRSERHWLAEQPGTGTAAGQDPAELGGVDGGLLAAVAVGEDATRRPEQVELERLAVPAGPFGHDVRHQAPVVLWREHEGASGCPRDVTPVVPGISRVRITSNR